MANDFEKQALLFYMQSEPRGTSPGPNVDSLLAVALTIGPVLRGTILNDVIFIVDYRDQPIQQPIKMM